jgi:hypothetical protein
MGESSMAPKGRFGWCTGSEEITSTMKLIRLKTIVEYAFVAHDDIMRT